MTFRTRPAGEPLPPDSLSPTEQRLEASMALDELPTVEVLRLLNEHDRLAVDAVSEVLDDLAALVDVAVDRFRRGGRIHYFGAGTSGRLAVLDAAELIRPSTSRRGGGSPLSPAVPTRSSAQVRVARICQTAGDSRPRLPGR